jgi:osmoprotectant transport system ATP-binding protein
MAQRSEDFMIRFEYVSKSYRDTLVLNDLNFEVMDGEFTVLIGPSGCGKTTTLKSVNRLIEPDKGKIYINGKDISTVDHVKLRRSIGYVIQQIGLFPNMTVEQNICVVPKLLKYDKARRLKITREMLDLVNMPYQEYAHKYPTELSGGQQQRVGVLRALAASPPIVLMDEPFGALDPMTRSVLRDEVRKIQRKLHKTILFVTHDMDEALDMADKIIFMDKGLIVQMATPGEMLENPANDLIRSFMGKRSKDTESHRRTAAEFMYTKVHSVDKNYGIHEAVNYMKRKSVDTLLIKNQDGTYAGIVSVKSIKDHGKDLKTIEPLIMQNYDVSYLDEDAQICFDKLFNGNGNYVVVLNSDNTVAGIVTKTSMAKALAETVWG